MLARASALPTFFSVDDERDLLRSVMSAGVDEINAHIPEFLALIDRVVESHTVGSGYMLVTPANKGVFREFLRWAARHDRILKTGAASLSSLVAELDLDSSIIPHADTRPR